MSGKPSISGGVEWAHGPFLSLDAAAGLVNQQHNHST